MILVEIPVKTLEEEALALSDQLQTTEGFSYIYALGARAALGWVINRRMKPSESLNLGTVPMTRQ